MEFKVPQFIDIEDKLFKGLTFTQLVYLAGGGSISYVAWSLLPILIALPVVACLAILSLLLAFYPKDKYGKPFVVIMESALRFYFVNTRLYTWKRVPKKKNEKGAAQNKKTISVTVPNISESNLKDLSWGLGIKEEV